jgi:hypothetical protein
MDGARPASEKGKETMEDSRQAVALVRYSLIRELSDPELTPRRRGAMVRALTEVDHALGDGRRLAVSAPTLRRWLRTWRVGGFEALVPGVRRRPNRIPDLLTQRPWFMQRRGAV